MPRSRSHPDFHGVRSQTHGHTWHGAVTVPTSSTLTLAKTVYTPSVPSAQQAAKNFDRLAFKIHGEEAKLNFALSDAEKADIERMGLDELREGMRRPAEPLNTQGGRSRPPKLKEREEDSWAQPVDIEKLKIWQEWCTSGWSHMHAQPNVVFDGAGSPTKAAPGGFRTGPPRPCRERSASCSPITRSERSRSSSSRAQGEPAREAAGTRRPWICWAGCVARRIRVCRRRLWSGTCCD